MIKILHVISDTNIGGAGIHLCNLLSEADRERFDYTVVLPENSALISRLKQLQIPVITLRNGADRSADLHAIPELIPILLRIRPHVVHTHSALYGRIAARLCHAPVTVSTRHCADMHERKAVAPVRLIRSCLDSYLCDHTVATAHYVRDVLVRRGISPNRITVIQNGSLSQPFLSPQEKQTLRATLGIGQNDFTVGIVARLASGKGHETFLQAVRLCAERSKSIRFLIIGSGERETELKKMATELGLSKSVQFLGFRTDAACLMNILDANVNCSERSETSSLSLSEGMSVGAVPVVSACGGNPFMAGFGENGIIFPVGDHHALADAILSLSHDRERLSALSHACQKRFSEEFTAKKMAEQTEALYKNLLMRLDTIPKMWFNKRKKHQGECYEHLTRTPFPSSAEELDGGY